MERVAEYMRLEGETEGSSSVDDNWPQGEVILEAAPRQKMAEDGKLEEASRVVPGGTFAISCVFILQFSFHVNRCQ